MPASEGAKKSYRKGPLVVVFIMLLLIGLFGLDRVTRGPQFESYHTQDIVQLVTSGACFGAALTGLMVMLLRPRT